MRDCNPNWAACPVAKRVWLENNPDIVHFLKREALKERGFFGDSTFSRNRKTHLPHLNKALRPVAKKAIEEGLYKESTGLQAVGEMLQRYVERAYGIKRLWLKDGWKQVMTGKKFDPAAAQSIYRPVGEANSFRDARK